MGHILVVDDDDMNRDILMRHLQRMGHVCSQAASGEEALTLMNIAEQGDPLNLVMLDIMMPVMDGYEVLTRIKANPQLQHIPVIVLSAVTELESMVHCIELGAEDYLLKPFNVVMLRSRVSRLFSPETKSKAPEKLVDALHEPLTHSMRLIDQLISKAAGPVNETQVEMLGLVQSRLVQMLRTLNQRESAR
jgi:DNA-binding response OmpR family regulator